MYMCVIGVYEMSL